MVAKQRNDYGKQAGPAGQSLMEKMTVREKYIALAKPILQRLECAGFEAYLVGGCVREALRAQREGSLCADADPRAACAASELTDIDVTTNALPEEICGVFSDLTVIDTGIRHGTVTVLVPVPGEERIPIEITTYRVDGNYSDGRHPDQVRFVTSLTEDLRRRDFTVNAMAMDLRGTLQDPFDGQADLAAGIIRAVGDPQTRFQEDGLRILRALRFAAVLTRAEKRSQGARTEPEELASQSRTDRAEPAAEVSQIRAECAESAADRNLHRGFCIEPVTEAALFQCAHLLKGISAERIFAELKKLLCGPAAGDAVRRYADVLAVVIPQLASMKGFDQHNPYHNYDVLEHCIRAMENIRAVPRAALTVAAPAQPTPAANTAPPAAAPAQPTPAAAAPAYLKLAALLHDVGKPETFTRDAEGIGHFYGHPQAGAQIVRQVLRRLKADRWTIDRITTLVHYHDLVFQEDDRLLKRWINRYTPQVLLEILEIKRADNIATGNASGELLDKFDRIEVRIRRILEQHDRGEASFCIRDLAVNGRNLIEAGIPEGPRIGQMLQRLLEAVIDDELPNEREALLERAREMKSEPAPRPGRR